MVEKERKERPATTEEWRKNYMRRWRWRRIKRNCMTTTTTAAAEKTEIMLCMHCHLTSFRITYYTSRMICRGAFVIIFIVGVSLSSLFSFFIGSIYYKLCDSIHGQSLSERHYIKITECQNTRKREREKTTRKKEARGPRILSRSRVHNSSTVFFVVRS